MMSKAARLPLGPGPIHTRRVKGYGSTSRTCAQTGERNPFPEPEKRKHKHKHKHKHVRQNRSEGVMNNIIRNIPRILTEKTSQKLRHLFKKEHEQREQHEQHEQHEQYIWVIRLLRSYGNYFSVRDETEHYAIIGFRDKILAERALFMIRLFTTYDECDTAEADHKYIDEPLIIERLELSFLHDVCVTTSLNLIVLDSRYNKNDKCREIVTERICMVRESLEHFRLIFEERFKF